MGRFKHNRGLSGLSFFVGFGLESLRSLREGENGENDTKDPELAACKDRVKNITDFAARVW